MEKKYWQNFGDLTNSDAFDELKNEEFKDGLLPIEELREEGLFNGKTPRRDFLKYLGFSTAAATLAASCEMPVRKAVPFLQKPENIIPGVADFYASTYVKNGDAISVVVKQRDGRPIKIEGNDRSPITRGGTSAQAQASVLDLYDTTRLRHPLQKDGANFKEVSSFDAFDKMIGSAMAGLGGKPVVLLTSTINSPSTLQVINDFLAKLPGSRHVQYDAVSYSGMLQANEASYGKRTIPSYHFDKAKIIVSLGADFLGTWLSPVEFSYQYSLNRKIEGEKPELSRHIQFESMLSLTGSNADDRYTHKPSQTAAIALALLSKLGGTVSAPSFADQKLSRGIEQTAALLLAARGTGLVVCGSNDVNIQILVNEINEKIGAVGSTIDYTISSNYRKGIDADMVKLESDLASGNVGALLIHDCNPVYSYANGRKFGDALSKLPLSVSFNLTMDETTEQCKYVIPSHHWLESWGDAEPKTGYVSVIQPIINPLFKTRPFQTSLIKWLGGEMNSITAVKPADTAASGNINMALLKSSSDEYENYFRNYWAGKLGNEQYNEALQKGMFQSDLTVSSPVLVYNVTKVGEAATKVAAAKTGTVEVTLYEKVSIGNGSQANNPWLQELPDPISKVTWDNYAIISPQLAKTLLDIDIANPDSKKDADKYEVTPEKPVIKITVNNISLSLPALILPGVDPSTIAIAVGYGRQSADKNHSKERIGLSAIGAGQNAYPFTTFDGQTFQNTSVATVSKTGDVYTLAQMQVHGSSENRPVIYETNLSAYRENPEELLEEPREERKTIMAEGKTDFVRDATIYPDYDKPGIKWGMSIDLNTCTGCNACVVACTAENNVSVVGKMQVTRYHDMHWLRIDRYFTGDPTNPDVVFQPMLCQHCDNAPCENVCPVAATNHSSEGLNQMAYNRCIGTRYCANNCPYKVRRFNWLDFTGADSFPDNQNPLIGVDLNEVTLQMNDDLTRMVLNPDVTVRSRGVMEKCTFCVQRLQDGKLEAKKRQDPAFIRNLKTACSQACPTNAISFGNVNDKESEIWKIRNKEQVNRNFYVLDQLHTLPNVNYLAKVRNTNRHLGAAKEELKGEVHNEKVHA